MESARLIGVRTIDFFGLPQTNAPPGMLVEWEAIVPLSRLVESIGPLTLKDLMERHHFFRFQIESRKKPGHEN